MAGVEGRAVLVTGGATAVGRALAIDLAAHGASVGVIDVDDAHGDETVAHIADAGGQAFYRHADVRDESEVAAAIDEVVQRFGRLDGAVNNAGTEAPMALLDADVATFQEVLDVNLVGVFRCLKHEALAMRRQGGGGAIVNVSSTSTRRRSRRWPPSPPGGCCRCPSSPPRSGSCSTPRRATWWRRRS